MNIRKNIYTLSDAAASGDSRVPLSAAKAEGAYDRVHRSPPPFDDDRDALSPGEVGGATFKECGASRTGVPAVAPLLLPGAGARSSNEEPARDFALLGLGRGCRQSSERGAVEYEPGAADLHRRRSTGPGGVVNTGPFAELDRAHRGTRGAPWCRGPAGSSASSGSNPDFGSGIGVPSFPTVAQVNDVIANFATYDTSPWRTASVGSFRNRLEGWWLQQ